MICSLETSTARAMLAITHYAGAPVFLVVLVMLIVLLVAIVLLAKEVFG